MAQSDRGVAPLPGEQRADRGDQQSREARQASRLRDAPLPQLPATGAALRRPPELDPPRHPHPTVKSEEPEKLPVPSAATGSASQPATIRTSAAAVNLSLQLQDWEATGADYDAML